MYADMEEEVFLTEVSGMDAGDVDTQEILQRMGGKAGTFTEVRPDGTTVTYEVDVEEVRSRNRRIYSFQCIGVDRWPSSRNMHPVT